MVYEYSWVNFNYAVPANIVGEECEKIEKRDGAITVEALVDSAREKSSAIHELFEWDNEVAGEEWRKQQARIVLHNLKVVVRSETADSPVRVRAFVNTNPERTQGKYMNVEEAMSNEEARAGVLIRAKRELTAFTDKYSSIKELDGVVKVIKKYLATH